MENNKKVLVSFSGGADSAILLSYLIGEGFEPSLVLYTYGSKHQKNEVESSKKLAEIYGVDLTIIDLPFFRDHLSSPMFAGEERTQSVEDEDFDLSSVNVPFRNGIFIALTTALAEQNEIRQIAVGFHKGEGGNLPDCTKAFHKYADLASRSGTYNGVSVLAPFIDDTKQEVIGRGIDLGVPFEHTWTCFEGGDAPCGVCFSCSERIEAFSEFDRIDPLIISTLKKKEGKI